MHSKDYLVNNVKFDLRKAIEEVALKEEKELEESPMILQSQGALKILADRLIKKLEKEGLNRRVQLMTQIGKILGIKVKVLPNGKVELR